MHSVLLSVLVVLVSTAWAAPVTDDSTARIIKYENNNDGSGNYDFSYETSNGLSREEVGVVVLGERDNELHIVVTGSYSYIDTNGEVQLVRYTADENGYQIIPKGPGQGDLIPAPPVSAPIPAAALATLLG